MSENNEIIYDSPTSDPEDEFWLQHGRQMITESLGAVRSAANALITALGVIQGFYLGILGFSDFIHDQMNVWKKAIFLLPIVFWLISIYLCVNVVMTRKIEVFLHTPEDIKKKSMNFTLDKQNQLRWGFWLLTFGLISAFALFIVRMYW